MMMMIVEWNGYYVNINIGFWYIVVNKTNTQTDRQEIKRITQAQTQAHAHKASSIRQNDNAYITNFVHIIDVVFSLLSLC